MKGNVYTRQKCPRCGGGFVHYEGAGMFCPTHKKIMATGDFYVKFGKEIRKTFSTYAESYRFLTGVRFKSDEKTLDVRAYQSDNPLAFSNQAKKYMLKKEKTVSVSQFRNIKNNLNRAISEWGDRNVNDIQYADIEDFIDIQTNQKTGEDLSGKTKDDILSTLKTFWDWMLKRKSVRNRPDFPDVDYILGEREIVTFKEQFEVLEEIRRLSWHLNPKIWLGIKWLMTYIGLRPNELRNVQEKHINRFSGSVTIPSKISKDRKAKTIFLIEEDLDLLNDFPIALPDVYFFRHDIARKGVRPGQFGKHLFYNYAMKACNNLGITGIDLYGLTRHTSTTGAGRYVSPDTLKDASMHGTNKAFDRYYRSSTERAREVYELINELRSAQGSNNEKKVGS